MKKPTGWLPTRQELMDKPWMGPFRAHLANDRLWELERQNVARAVAIGLFVGLLLPAAQAVAAIALAVMLRGHVMVSLACTFVSNPLTFPPIYWAAYKIGGLMLPTGAMAAHLNLQEGAWMDPAWLLGWAKAAGGPTALGLVTLATAAAVLGYLTVMVAWRQRSRINDV